MFSFDIVTIFPEVIDSYKSVGVLSIAQKKGLVEINAHNLRKWTKDKHKTVDGTPCGGGPGMILKVEPIYDAIQELKRENTIVAITTPTGQRLTQKKLRDFSIQKDLHMIILCGRYEGFDQRILDHLVDYSFSIGDYVLAGGELASLVLTEGITRLVPGVLGNKDSLLEESFDSNLLEYPQYTQPEDFHGWRVPPILLSGDHQKIEDYRNSLRREAKN